MNIDELKKLELSDGEIVSVEFFDGTYEMDGRVTEGLPPVYKIMVESRLGGDSYIRHEVWLPENWNGRFLGLGNGGIAGKIDPDNCRYCREGYAVAQTDCGTSALRAGQVKVASRELWMDKGWRSTHVMTTVAKELIRAHYGKDAEYSYFRGASAGGAQAFSEAQNFPEDYDGILAFVPSNNTLYLIAYFLWCHICLCDKDARPYISDAEKAQIHKCAVEYFSKFDEIEAGESYVCYGWAGENTVENFLAFLREKMPSLTDFQIEALRKLYTGPVNPKTGEQIYCGMPIGSEMNCGYMGESGASMDFGFPWFKIFFGEGFSDRDFDFADCLEKMVESVGEDFTKNKTDLSAFMKSGGKIIVYSGGEDPYGPWADAMNYYNRVCAEMGGYENVSRFFRYFVMPGRGHSTNGLGVNRVYSTKDGEIDLNALRRWCEEKIAPECLYGARVVEEKNEAGELIGEKTRFLKPIYPYKADKVEGIDYPRCTAERYLRCER